MNQLKLISIICLLLLLLDSCQVVKEVHYIRAGENYFKLNVKASAFASKSRYLAGYFDENAVDNYFSELSKKDTINYFYKESKINGKTESEEVKGMDNTKLVMILSSNSDVVSDQIGNLAQNEQTLDILARLANKDKIEENKNLSEKVSNLLDQNKAIISTGDIYINSLADKSITEMNILLNYLNYISAIKGLGFSFNSVQEAEDWLNENKE